MKVLALRRNDTCVSCDSALTAGTKAGWDSTTQTVTCLPCLALTAAQTHVPEPAHLPPPLAPIDRGTAGASVTREAERRAERHRKRQEERVVADRERRAARGAEHPVLGRAVNLVTPKVEAQPAPQHVKAWTTGAPGERAVGEALDRIQGIVVLHDRRKVRSRGNIDHVAITPAGVWVIDTKRSPGKKIEYRNLGGWFRSDERLYVDGRDRTKLVDNTASQVNEVYEACTDLLADTVVRPALCFVDGTVGWLAKPFLVRGVVVLWPSELDRVLTRPGPFDSVVIEQIARRISEWLPSA